MGFGDDFLAKRYQAGYDEGYKEGFEIGRAEGIEIGRAERRAEFWVELLKFLEENPGATAEQIEAWARDGVAPPVGK